MGLVARGAHLMRRFFVQDLEGACLTLDPTTSHHLLRVVRIGRDEEVLLFDGKGLQRRACLDRVQDGLAVLRPLSPPIEAHAHKPLHVWLGLPRNPAADMAVRMATEAGATHICPFFAERSSVRSDRRDRLIRIASSAAGQCGRSDIPTVFPVQSLADLLSSRPPDLHLWVATPSGTRSDPPQSEAGDAVVIGPEGGLTPREIEACVSSGGTALTLGNWILRTDTAVAVAVATLAQRT